MNNIFSEKCHSYSTILQLKLFRIRKKYSKRMLVMNADNLQSEIYNSLINLLKNSDLETIKFKQESMSSNKFYFDLKYIIYKSIRVELEAMIEKQKVEKALSLVRFKETMAIYYQNNANIVLQEDKLDETEVEYEKHRAQFIENHAKIAKYIEEAEYEEMVFEKLVGKTIIKIFFIF